MSADSSSSSDLDSSLDTNHCSLLSLSEDHSKTQRRFYLDHAAASPLDPKARAALQKMLKLGDFFYNPDAAYQDATMLRRSLLDLQKKTAKLVGLNDQNLIFSEGGSSANTAFFHLVKLSVQSSNPEAIVSSIEHSTVLKSLEDLGFRVHKIPPNNQRKGLVEVKDLLAAVNEKTALISLQYVNNEIGTVQPIKDLAAELRLINRGRKERVWLHSDGAQAAKTEDLNFPRIGVDALSLNGSKFGALPGSGALLLGSDFLRNLNSKAEATSKLNTLVNKKVSILSATAFYIALKSVIEKKNSETKRLLGLSKEFLAELQRSESGVKLNPAGLTLGKNHSPHILNLSLPNLDAEKLVILAGLHGLDIATGAACSASRQESSHVLEALGLGRAEINSSIRISFGSANRSLEEVRAAAKMLHKLQLKLREIQG